MISTILIITGMVTLAVMAAVYWCKAMFRAGRIELLEAQMAEMGDYRLTQAHRQHRREVNQLLLVESFNRGIVAEAIDAAPNKDRHCHIADLLRGSSVVLKSAHAIIEFKEANDLSEEDFYS